MSILKIVSGGIFSLLILSTHALLVWQLILMSDLTKFKNFLKTDHADFVKFYLFFLGFSSFVLTNIILGRITAKLIFQNKNEKKDNSVGVGDIFSSIWSFIKSIISIALTSLFLSLLYIMLEGMLDYNLFNLSKNTKEITNQVIFWVSISLCSIIGLITIFDLCFSAYKIIHNSLNKNNALEKIDSGEFSYSCFCISNFIQIVFNERNFNEKTPI